jgi:hypothetical protein
MPDLFVLLCKSLECMMWELHPGSAISFYWAGKELSAGFVVENASTWNGNEVRDKGPPG